VVNEHDSTCCHMATTGFMAQKMPVGTRITAHDLEKMGEGLPQKTLGPLAIEIEEGGKGRERREQKVRRKDGKRGTQVLLILNGLTKKGKNSIY